MKAILIDAYRSKDKIVLWVKNEDNIRLEFDYSTRIFLEKNKLSQEFIKNNNLDLKSIKKKDYEGNLKEVYEYSIDKISRYEKIVRLIELQTKHELNLYNADISPEQQFLYEHNIAPFDAIEIHEGKIIKLPNDLHPDLKKMEIYITHFKKIISLIANGKEYKGTEKQILESFAKDFEAIDPDVIVMNNAFSKLPYLYSRLEHYGIKCSFHRWDEKPILPKGGKSFFTYGKVIYRDYAVRLNGRFLVDEGSVVGTECDLDGIIEISRLCGTRFQQVGSRSFGAAFQSSLVREMFRKNILVPYKQKPVDPPMTMREMLKFDRVGHRMDAITGIHKNVAEIDFSSLFPWIIYNYNISPENFKDEEPCEKIPNLNLKISLRRKGLVPSAIKPILDRRMHYKKNPTLVNKSRIQGLKWVLVTSYGYLRFREFKLGLATSHMAIGAYAREMLITAKEICEERGYRVVHGIVDALYIQKENITEEEVKSICSEIELRMGVPVSFEGIFKWIVFLPSINDEDRPVPTKYYGLFQNDEIKIRGIEARTVGAPNIIKSFQLSVIQDLAQYGEQTAYLNGAKKIRAIIKNLKKISPNDLACRITISKTDYKQDNAQSQAIKQLQKRGFELKPGHKVNYIHTTKGAVIPEEYFGNPDKEQYKKMLVRSLFVLFQPLGYSKDDINSMTENERQMQIFDYENDVEELII